jgi:hypothetical protein
MITMNTQKEFYTVHEVAALLGKHRATIFDRIKVLGITVHKFRRDRKTYLTSTDVERIRLVLGDQPWMAGLKQEQREEISS